MKPVTKAIRAERRAFAEKQQAEYDKLTLQQKLDKLPPAPACAKQRAKLEAQLKAQQEKAATKVQKPSSKKEDSK